MRKMFSGDGFFTRLYKFLHWTARQVFIIIPEAMTTVSFGREISRTPIWLIEENPLADIPWSKQPQAILPDESEVVVIGAGFTGAGCAYFWSKHDARPMVILEMDDPASGASGRNGGEIVMGRYYALVKNTVRPYRFLDVFSGTGTISFTEKTQPEYLFRTLLPQCVSIMARLP